MLKEAGSPTFMAPLWRQPACSEVTGVRTCSVPWSQLHNTACCPEPHSPPRWPECSFPCKCITAQLFPLPTLHPSPSQHSPKACCKSCLRVYFLQNLTYGDYLKLGICPIVYFLSFQLRLKFYEGRATIFFISVFHPRCLAG